MHAGQELTIEQLRRESEVTRAALTNTVGALRAKLGDTTSDVKALLSPAHLTQEVKDYADDTKNRLFQTLDRKIRENPLQAAAVGAAVAYPFWSIFRKMPAPLLLIGAGFLLAKHKTGNAGPAGADLSAPMENLHAPHIKDAPSIVSDANQKAVEKFQETTDKIRDTAHAATDAIATAAETASDRLLGAAGSAQAYAADTAARWRATTSEVFDKNPLAVAGLAAVAGALIAALLPNSRVENRVLGPYRDELKEKAAGGVAELKKAADQTIEQVSENLQREGLSSEGIKEAVTEVRDRAMSVAERGLQALTKDPSSTKQPAHSADS